MRAKATDAVVGGSSTRRELMHAEREKVERNVGLSVNFMATWEMMELMP